MRRDTELVLFGVAVVLCLVLAVLLLSGVFGGGIQYIPGLR